MEVPEGETGVSVFDATEAIDGSTDAAVGERKVLELIERAGIDVADIGRVEKIKLWQGMIKNGDNEPEVVDLCGVVLSPKWAEGPAWPVIQPCPPVKLPTPRVKAVKASGWKTAVVLPDMQIGYYRGADGLVSTHDETAIDIAVAIIQRLSPDLVVMVGDNLDFPELGKYRLSSAFQQTTQAAIDYAGLLMARLRAAAPAARIVWLAGNHEERLPNFTMDNAKAAHTLRQSAPTPTDWPVLSVPHLCRLNDVDVEFVPGYPANKWWVNERLKVIHGHRVKSGGSTAHLYLGSEATSVIYGHVHRIELAHRTQEKWEGAKQILAASPGCLAKTTGAVPSTKGGVDLDGRPLPVVEDWQQGCAVVRYEDEGDHRFVYEQVSFLPSGVLYAGNWYPRNQPDAA